jgi:hypothetical protein
LDGSKRSSEKLSGYAVKRNTNEEEFGIETIQLSSEDIETQFMA